MTFRLSLLWPYLSLVGIVVLGSALRLDGLLERDLWYDEAFTGITIRQTWSAMMDIVMHDVHPPLYYWLLKLWSLPFGSSALALRSFSAFLGTATVVLAYAVVRKWQPQRRTPAIVASFVVAINPFLISYSQEARMYAMVGALLLLCAFLLVRSWLTPTAIWRLSYGGTLLALFLTHYLSALFILCFVIADGIWWLQQTKRRASPLLTAYLPPLIGVAAWLPTLLSQMSQGGLGWVPAATLERLPITLHIFLFGGPVGVLGLPPAAEWQISWLTVPSIGAAITLVVTTLMIWLIATKQWNGALRLTTALTVIPPLLTLALQSADINLYVERYLIGSAIFLLLFLVLAVSAARHRWPVVAAAGAYLILTLLIQPQVTQPSFPDITNALNNLPDAPNVIFTDPFNYVVGRFYLGEAGVDRLQLYNLANPREDFSGWAAIAQQAPVTALPKTPHIIVTQQPSAFPTHELVATINNYAILQARQ